jgi:hypothetical protein
MDLSGRAHINTPKDQEPHGRQSGGGDIVWLTKFWWTNRSRYKHSVLILRRSARRSAILDCREGAGLGRAGASSCGQAKTSGRSASLERDLLGLWFSKRCTPGKGMTRQILAKAMGGSRG